MRCYHSLVFLEQEFVCFPWTLYSTSLHCSASLHNFLIHFLPNFILVQAKIWSRYGNTIPISDSFVQWTVQYLIFPLINSYVVLVDIFNHFHTIPVLHTLQHPPHGTSVYATLRLLLVQKSNEVFSFFIYLRWLLRRVYGPQLLSLFGNHTIFELADLLYWPVTTLSCIFLKILSLLMHLYLMQSHLFPFPL